MGSKGNYFLFYKRLNYTILPMSRTYFDQGFLFKTILLSYILLCALSSPIFSQDSTSIDSTKHEIKKRKFIFAFDTRNSFVSSQRAKVFGYKLGIQKYDKYRWGFGFYSLKDPISREITLNENLDRAKTTAQFTFDYVSIFYERILYYDHKWEVTLPIQIGGGSSRLSYIAPTDSAAVDTSVGGISFFEPTISGHYKFLKWAGIGMGVGYRFNLQKNDLLDEKLNSFIYVFKLKIFLGDLYSRVFKRKKKKKKKHLEQEEINN